MGTAIGRRSATALAVALLTLLLVSGPAIAIGVSGVELRLDLPRRDDTRFVTVGDEAVPLSFELENLEAEPREVRLFAAAAGASDGGAITVGRPGSAPWFGLEDQTVALRGGESRTFETTIDPRKIPEDDGTEHLGVIVIESVDNGDTLVTRAAAPINVVGAGLPPARAGAALVGGAVVLLVTMALAGREVLARRRDDEDQTTAEPVAV